MNTPKKWIVKRPDIGIVEELANKLGISRAVCKVLVNRGISSVEEAEKFLSPDVKNINNPFLLPDIYKGVERIKKSIGSKEKILVYGDRDVDGVTSTYIIVKTIKSLGGDVEWYVPSSEGYGLNSEVIRNYSLKGVKLIVTVDCGITAVKEIADAKALGIDVVVTDHHEPTEDGLPDAIAIIDPKVKGSKYPFNGIAGCCVAFKLAMAIMHSYGKYFNEELAVVDLNKDELSLTVLKNGLIEKELSFDVSKDAGWKSTFLEMTGKKRIVVKSQATLDELARLADISNTFIVLSLISREAIDQSNLTGSSRVASAFLDHESKSDLRMNFFIADNIDMVALGTIADIMPLLNENRIFVREGLKYLAGSKKPGVQALMESCIKRKPTADTGISAKAVSWDITPVLNAAGRRGKADLSVKLLLSANLFDAHNLLDKILELNSQRKELQAENLEVFAQLTMQQCDVEKDKILVVTADGVEHGVTGIVASQLMRKYSRPVLLLILDGEEAVGAVRSIEGFDIVSVLDSLKHLLVKYGGHSMAAGLTIKKSLIGEFTSKIKAVAEEKISYEMLFPSLDIDAELEFSELKNGLIDDLEKMEPFGTGNPNPMFSIADVKINSCESLGIKNEHLKLKITKDGKDSIEALGWSMGKMAGDIKKLNRLDLAFQLEYNVWKNKKSLQLVISDIKPNLM